MRRHHPRRPRPVHVGRHAARRATSPASRPSTRWGSSSRIMRGARGRLALRRRGRARPGQRTATTSSPRSFPSCAAPCRRTVASIGHFDGREDALTFANSQWAEELCQLGTSCPDHFLRTRISPMFVPWDAGAERSRRSCKARSPSGSSSTARTTPPTTRRIADRTRRRFAISNPSVVVIPGLGLFGFGKDKREARITTEFFVNAIHVMAGANALGSGRRPRRRTRAAPPQVRRPDQAEEFKTLPATTSRCRARRRSASNTGRSRKRSCSACRRSASSAARSWWSSAAAAASAARWRCRSPARGGHVVVADQNVAAAEEAAQEAAALSSKEHGASRPRSI